MAQTQDTETQTVGDAFREVADFFDRFPSLVARNAYPTVPLGTTVIVDTPAAVAAVARMFDATPHVHTYLALEQVHTRFTVSMGRAEVTIVHITPIERELRRPAAVTETLSERDA